MSARAWWLTWGLLLLTSAATAQTTIGFETDCTGTELPASFVAGYANIDSGLYAACGVSSITSGGSVGQQRLTRPLFGSIEGATGETSLAGATDINGSISLAPLVIVFSRPVNDVSFDALDLDNASGLQVVMQGVDGTMLFDLRPTVTNRRVRVAQISAVPISRLTIRYTPAIGLPDFWFLDQLTFKAWVCGDGVIDSNDVNPTKETCDDGNRVQCDGCSNSCAPSVPGCFDGTTCIAPGTSTGCSRCDVATPIGSDGNRPTTLLPVATACDDGLFCTVGDACDATGKCAAAANPCSDGVVCTVDSCDEATDTCLHPIEAKWCLLGGTSCVENGTTNPANPCEICTSAALATAWTKQPVGLACGDPTCSAGLQLGGSTCDAGGVCQPGAMMSCQFATCANAVSCTGTCSDDQECPGVAHCVLGACEADLPPARGCSRNSECASNFCVDGVCCDKACNDACESCNLVGKAGICTPLADKTFDPEPRCGPGQYCSAEGTCTLPAPEPPVVLPPTVIDKRPAGAGCTSNDVCGSGVCKDAVCCDRACEGTCEACNVLGQPPGQCTPFARGTDPEEECGGSGAVCDGASACTAYETRGNGLCAATPRPARYDGLLALLSLLSLSAVLAARRLR